VPPRTSYEGRGKKGLGRTSSILGLRGVKKKVVDLHLVSHHFFPAKKKKEGAKASLRTKKEEGESKTRAPSLPRLCWRSGKRGEKEREGDMSTVLEKKEGRKSNRGATTLLSTLPRGEKKGRRGGKHDRSIPAEKKKKKGKRRSPSGLTEKRTIRCTVAPCIGWANAWGGEGKNDGNRFRKKDVDLLRPGKGEEKEEPRAYSLGSLSATFGRGGREGRGYVGVRRFALATWGRGSATGGVRIGGGFHRRRRGKESKAKGAKPSP